MSELDATFTVGGVRLTTRLLDGRFPDYRQLIPPGYPNLLRVGREALLDALRRVRLLVRDNTTPVRLSMRPGSVELTVVSQEVGHASEDVDAEYEGEELTVAFNPSYLIDGVEAVLGDEVVLETVDATKPATVRAPDHEDYRYLLMPVQGVVATRDPSPPTPTPSPWPSPRCGSPTSGVSPKPSSDPTPRA